MQHGPADVQLEGQVALGGQACADLPRAGEDQLLQALDAGRLQAEHADWLHGMFRAGCGGIGETGKTTSQHQYSTREIWIQSGFV